jgi:hypothetical protein
VVRNSPFPPPAPLTPRRVRYDSGVHDALGAMRRILLAILVIGLAGLGIELLLLKHDEGATQLIPLVLIAIAFVAIGWHVVRPASITLAMVQVTMVLFVAAGALGILLHYQANVEFQREVDPSIAGRALFVKAITAKTPPALAPGSMSQLGLIGLAYAYCYPSRRRPIVKNSLPPGGRV